MNFTDLGFKILTGSKIDFEEQNVGPKLCFRWEARLFQHLIALTVFDKLVQNRRQEFIADRFQLFLMPTMSYIFFSYVLP